MIRVHVIRKDGHTRSLHCVGHADYSKRITDKDVVCAGVSAIVINTVNCLEDLLSEDMTVDADEENGGDLTVNFGRNPGEKGEFLIDCMIHGLEWIETQYGTKYLNHQITEL